MNSVLSRAPGRRGGRRPGWTLLTALLILAIAASSALVFTSRVELLKLAVIVALWAAVASAFVSVIYRRQSDVDQARARDLKLVYDLQLDREISARREYELTVESQLRRELASELRAQAADEVAALRTELSALRTNLEILFDADLSHRPALETESSGRTTIRAYSDWARTGSEAVTGARPAPATASFYPEDAVTKTSEHPIIDVPEVRIPTGAIPMPSTPQPHQPPQQPPAPRGAHHRAADEPQMPSQKPPRPQQPQPNAGRWAQPAQPFVAPEQHREPEPPPPPSPPQQPWAAPAAPVPTPTAAPAPKSEPFWKPVGAEGEWLPPGAPGSNWLSATPVESSRHGDSGRHGAKEPDAETPSRHGRHSGPSAAEGTGGRRRAESRHSAESVESPGSHAAPEPAPEPTPAPVAEPAPEPVPAPRLASPPPASARHSTGPEAVTDGAPSTGGQSVAELLARLQTVPGEGRRRRRRED